jgi:hypothetical protein
MPGLDPGIHGQCNGRAKARSFLFWRGNSPGSSKRRVGKGALCAVPTDII